MSLSISIVTPSFNQGAFIERTLASVLNQTAAVDEVMVCDGGSSDETVAVLKSFGDRIRWVSERDDGQAAAVNNGIGRTNGEIIGWLNSDDVYYPQTIETVREFFESNPEVDVVYGSADFIDEQDKKIGMYPTEAWSPDRLPSHCIISQPAAFFRRRIVSKVGLLDARLHYCMDYEYWLRSAEARVNFAHVPQSLAATRIHKDTKSCALRLKCLKEINEMLGAKFGRVPDTWVLASALAKVETRGITRRRPLRFAASLAGELVKESVSWNSRLTWGLIKTAIERTIHHARFTLGNTDRQASDSRISMNTIHPSV